MTYYFNLDIYYLCWWHLFIFKNSWMLWLFKNPRSFDGHVNQSKFESHTWHLLMSYSSIKNDINSIFHSQTNRDDNFIIIIIIIIITIIIILIIKFRYILLLLELSNPKRMLSTTKTKSMLLTTFDRKQPDHPDVLIVLIWTIVLRWIGYLNISVDFLYMTMKCINVVW